MDRNGLRVVRGEAGGAAEEAIRPAPDPVAFQEECLRAFEVSQAARGFSEVTIGNRAGTLQRFLAAFGRPAWEVTREDVDRVVGELAAQGLPASTRRLYVQAFKGFHAFLVARKAAAIEAAFGVRLADPVDEFNAARHVGADSPSVDPPPSPERLEDFFGFLRERVASARKYAAAGRDYALFQTLYLAGLRADEAAMLDRSDAHFGRGQKVARSPASVRVPCSHHDAGWVFGGFQYPSPPVAVYPEEVINGHRAFIARRRALRPSGVPHPHRRGMGRIPRPLRTLIGRHAPAATIRRPPGRGGPPQFPPPPPIRSAPPTPGSPSRLRFQALRRLHGLRPDFERPATPLSARNRAAE